MLQRMIEDYVMDKKNQGRARNTIKTSIFVLELFCDANDVVINWKKINRLLTAHVENDPLKINQQTSE